MYVYCFLIIIMSYFYSFISVLDDHSRIVLRNGDKNESASSDYINANMIRVIILKNIYIN